MSWHTMGIQTEVGMILQRWLLDPQAVMLLQERDLTWEKEFPITVLAAMRKLIIVSKILTTGLSI